MTHNDVLRSLRYALNLRDQEMAAIFDPPVPPETIRTLLAQEEGETPCSEAQLQQFLDGLIVSRRGPRPADAPPVVARPLTNNEILKKLRIAFSLVEADLIAIMASVDQPLSKGEIGALFRSPDHKHFRPCGDQVLRKFLRGLTQRLHPDTEGGLKT